MDARSTLLKEIQAEDFALYETALYLNGHPTCKSALEYYCARRHAAKALREQYEALYGPLTLYGNARRWKERIAWVSRPALWSSRYS